MRVCHREGYGNLVEIKHGNGLVSQYAYNLQIFVKVGDKVRKGQRIAKIGHKENTGKSHPHFQIIRDSHFSERNNNIIKKSFDILFIITIVAI